VIFHVQHVMEVKVNNVTHVMASYFSIPLRIHVQFSVILTNIRLGIHVYLVIVHVKHVMEV